MLFVLNADITEETHNFSDGEKSALSNLALAAIEGHHFILTSRSTALTLSKADFLSERERLFFLYLFERYSTLGTIKQCDLSQVDIVLAADVPTLSPDQAYLETFANRSWTEPTVLLCEHQSDCNWLNAALSAFKKQDAAYLGLDSKFEFRLGGGDTTADVLKELMSSTSRWIVCVVDSDISISKPQLGGTADRVLQQASKQTTARVLVEVLECHELENLTPDQLFNEPRFVSGIKHEMLKRIPILTKLGCSSLRLRADFKEGLSLKLLFDYSKTNNICLSNLTSEISESSPLLYALNRECLNATDCASKEDCQCIYFKGMGNRLLENTTKALIDKGNILWEHLPACLSNIINPLCKKLLDLGCAFPPIRS